MLALRKIELGAVVGCLAVIAALVLGTVARVRDAADRST
jgi:hypothetical protein